MVSARLQVDLGFGQRGSTYSVSYNKGCARILCLHCIKSILHDLLTLIVQCRSSCSVRQKRNT